MELGLNPGWLMPSQYQPNPSTGESTSGSLDGDDFGELLDEQTLEQSKPDNSFSGLVKEGSENENSAEIMDSEESDSAGGVLDVAPNNQQAFLQNPKKLDLSGAEQQSAEGEQAPAQKALSSKEQQTLESLDRLRMNFFMQDKPVFSGLKAPNIGAQAAANRYSEFFSATKGGFDPQIDPTVALKAESMELPQDMTLPLQSKVPSPATPQLEAAMQGLAVGEVSSESGGEVMLPGELQARQIVTPEGSSHLKGAVVNPQVMGDAAQPSIEEAALKLPGLESGSFESPLAEQATSGGEGNLQQGKGGNEGPGLQQEELAAQYEQDLSELETDSFEPGVAQLSAGSTRGPASPGAGSILAGGVTPFDQSQNQEAVDQATSLLIERGGGTARIKLSPEGMGDLELRVRVQGDKVAVNLVTDNPEVKELFEKSIKGLQDRLAEQNLKVESLNIQVADTRSGSGDLDQRGQQGQSNPNLGLLRDMMNQSRQESFARETGAFTEMNGVKGYGRGATNPDPISSALEAQKAKSRYLGDSRGQRLRLVG